MRSRSLVVIVVGVLAAIIATPATAVGGDEGDGDGGEPAPAPLLATPKADAETLLRELETLARTSIAAATNDPDNPYSPFPIPKGLGPKDANGDSPAILEATTRLEIGVLKSEIVLSTLDARAVASVTAQVCPNPQGKVSAHLKVSLAGGDRVIEARATGVSNDNAELTAPTVTVVAGKGAEAKLLEQMGKAILRQAEQAWRHGYCVKIDVSEGQSQSVKPKAKVPIRATAKPRFGGDKIKGPMTSKKTAGQKKVEPAKDSGSPAKFTYTAPNKTPETGSVELKSVSKRGIGIANLEYTTAGDLKVDGVVGVPPANITAVKCGGPVGAWDLAYTQPEAQSQGHITFTLAEDTLSGPYSASGTAGPVATHYSGTATFDGESGTLTLSVLGSVPVTVGAFCTNGVPPGG